MELLDRYLQAVRKNLPAKRRDDISEELRSNILAQVEDKEAELGRPLVLEEEEAILKGLGHPMLVAMRYQPHQYLVGPSVFPYYWFALRTCFAITMLVYTVVTGLILATRTVSASDVLAAVLRIPGILLNVAIWVTIVFVILEFTWEGVAKKCNLFDSWKPRTLPPLEEAGKSSPKHPLMELAGSLAFAIYLLILPRYPYLLIGPGALFLKNAPFQIAPAMAAAYWSFVALAFLQVAAKVLFLVRRNWISAKPYFGYFARAISFAVLLLLLWVPEYFVISPASAGIAKYQQMVGDLNHAIRMGLKVILFIVFANTVWELRRPVLDWFQASGSPNTQL